MPSPAVNLAARVFQPFTFNSKPSEMMFMFGTDQDPTENHNTDDANPSPVSGSADDAPQTAGEDPAVTPDQPGRRRKRTRAEMEAARAAGEVPPKRDRRASADVAACVEEPAPEPTPPPPAPTAATFTQSVNAIVEQVDSEVYPECNVTVVHHDYKALAKKKLKTFGKFAARAVDAARLWPKDPTRYFDVVGKIFVDVAADEDRGVIDALVLDLLPKSTIAAIERSGITVI